MNICTISLINICGYSSNPDFLICKNQSIKEGERLREELRPNSIRIREELRDRYLELWPAKEPTPK